MITKVLQQGLEGLVLKDLMSIYEPGKRHWLKVKKDYLFGGAMADSADLVVLGAWFGTGQKGGMMSVFLMGCFDPSRQKWYTVTKVHTGHDDKTLERLQDELQMIKISKEASKVPHWLKCTKTMIPDFVAKDPKKMPVWEITGAEFTQQHDVHTADGISIRFPRVTRIRDDKDWETATSLPELKVLFKKSKDSASFALPSAFNKEEQTDEEDEDGSKTKTPEKKSKKEKPDDIKKKKKAQKQESDDSDSESESTKGRKDTSKRKFNSSDEDEDSGGKKRNTNKRKMDIVDSDEEVETSNNGAGKYGKGVQDHKTSSNRVNGKDGAISSSPRKRKNSGSDSFHRKKTLPEVFTDVSVVLPEEINTAELQNLERYFIAYGGTLLKPNEIDQATHIIHKGSLVKKINKEWPQNARHVQLQWLWDSICNQKIQNTSCYSVTLPSC